MRLLAVLLPLIVLALLIAAGMWFYRAHNRTKERAKQLKAVTHDRDRMAEYIQDIQDRAVVVDEGEGSVADAQMLAGTVLGLACTLESELEQPEALAVRQNRRVTS